MRLERRQEPVAARPVLCLWSGRNPSRSGRRRREHKRQLSFLDDLTTDIRPPVERAGVSCPPLFGALTVEQLLQGEMRGCATDDDVPVLRFDIQLLTAAQLGSLHDLARKPDGQVLSPFADGDLRHQILHLPAIFTEYRI